MNRRHPSRRTRCNGFSASYTPCASKAWRFCFISHRMEEVFEIADRVTILRDGRWISTTPRAELTPATAISRMVGREVRELFRRERREPGAVRLSVRGLRREGAFQDVSFDLRAGEVLGFAGLVGARRTDIGLALFGIAPADAGEIELDGTRVTVTSPRDAMALGIAYSTEDRRQLGLVMPLSIAANVSLPSLPRFLSSAGMVRRAEERATAEAFRQRLSIRAPSVDTPASSLSGGNQQKVVISKWLETNPKVLILDEPTRGIDVGAKVEVHQLIDDLAARGMAIILISSDLPEVLAMSDRILVMREGRQMAIFDHDEASQERVLSAAMGQSGDVVPEGDGIDRDGRGRSDRGDRSIGGGRLSSLSRITHERRHSAPRPARAVPRGDSARRDRRVTPLLRVADSQLLRPAQREPAHDRSGHHAGRRGWASAGRADPQYRPVGLLDGRTDGLCGRHAADTLSGHAASAGRSPGHGHRSGAGLDQWLDRCLRRCARHHRHARYAGALPGGAG